MTASGKDQVFQSELLGYHLDLVEPDIRARVESGFDDAESLSAARAAVQSYLAPLDADTAPVIPAGLASRVVDRVERSRNILPFPSRLSDEPTEAAGEGGSRGGQFTMRELVGLAAVIALFAGVFVPGYQTARNNAQRVMCMSNLGTIGGGFELYGQSNGAYPFAGNPQSNASRLVPGNAAGRAWWNNSRHAFQLVRGRYVQPDAFICKAREGDFPMDLSALDDDPQCFPSPRNNSYSWPFMDGPMRLRVAQPLGPRGGDMNPHVDPIRPRGTLESAANSLSHGRPGGQNVLRVNVSVIWTKTPRVGIDQDDIYRVADVKGDYTGLERPRSLTDAFLIP